MNIREIIKDQSKRKMLIFSALGIVGIILVLIGIFGSGSSKKQEKTVENLTDEAYIDALENKICNMIAKVTGDSNAAVVITSDGGTEHVYVSNGDGGDYVTVRNDGDYSLVLLREMYPKITGISVACKNGDDPEIKKKLIGIISTALGVSSNRIFIVGTK